MAHNEHMRIGEYQELEVVRESPQGLYLADEEADVLLPNSQCPPGTGIGDVLRVFVYTDSEDRPIATRKTPKATVGEFAKLPVVSVTGHGAFLNWGLEKDLFLPIREMQHSLRAGDEVMVRVYLDPVSQRVTSTTNLNKYLQPNGEGLTVGQAVDIMVVNLARDVISVIIDGHIKGSLFPDEWHEKLELGEVRSAYIKQIRAEDLKVAVSLRPVGYQAVIGERDRLLRALKESGGSLPVSDKSSPEEIHRRFGLSKSAFKKLIGTLYREGLISLEASSIRLNK